jgi:hypothetical protein
MDPSESAVLPDRRRRRTIVIVAGIAVVVAGALLAYATRSRDSESGSGLSEIGAPAVVSGLEPAGGTTGIAAGSGGSAPAAEAGADASPVSSDIVSEPFQRLLLESGRFDCVAPGLWQPYPDRQLIIPVGEPGTGQTCEQGLITLPPGSCTTQCSAIPDDWEIRLRRDLPAETLLVLVTPDPGGETARFYCYRNFVNDRVQYLPTATGIAEACPDVATTDSVDIPYVPPDTADIPTAPSS